jgi:biopolymer transport protein ExbD
MAGGIAESALDDDDFTEAHEINVTPFIDVMLVLLIIFMVAAPLSTVDLPIDLSTSSVAPQKRPEKPIYVTLKSDLAVFLNEIPVRRVDLIARLDSQGGAKDKRVFLRADRMAPCGELMTVLEMLRNGGYTKVALVALEGIPAAPSPADSR